MRRYLISSVAIAAILAPAVGLGQTVNIDNGVGGAGHLDVNIDAYGAYGNWNAAYTDNFEPTGAASGQPTFSAGFRLFSGQDRVLLTDMSQWNGTLTGGTWLRTITTPVFNVNAFTASSSFEVTGAFPGDPAILSFDVRQIVSSGGAGVAILDQFYTITNVSGSGMSFNMNRVLDADLIWGTSFTDDHVAAAPGLAWVVMHNPGSTTQAMAMSAGPGAPNNFYWGGKQSHVPTGGPPAFGFGSDVVVWDNFGLPTTWENYMSYVGYNTAGDSGTFAQDGHVGLNWHLSLGEGASTNIAVRTVYGDALVPEPATMLALGAGLALLIRRRRRKTSQ